MLAKLFMKLFGKKTVDGLIEKTGISKTKVVAFIGALISGYEILGPAFGWPKIPNEVYGLLGSLGLWALRDGEKKQAPDAPPVVSVGATPQ